MKKFLYRFTMLLVILGGAALFVAVHHYDLITVREAVCHADTSELNIPFKQTIDQYQGRSVFDFPSSDYLDTLFTNYPQLRKASVRTDPRGIISLDYDLKKPIVYIQLDQIYGLTSCGEVVPPDGGDYPVITGISGRRTEMYSALKSRKLAYILKVASLCHEFDGVNDVRISTVNLAHESGLAVHIEGCRTEIVMGLGNEQRKFERLVFLADYLCSLAVDFETVDFRFNNQLVLKEVN